MRISDWSSDVCSSDLLRAEGRYRVLSEDCLEGDDYIGILATRTYPMDRVIVSEDKDMQTLPNVKIWRQDKLVETTAESAENFWLYQTLMGDSTNGYKRYPGCGHKADAAILQKAEDTWEKVLKAYRHDFAKDKEP